MSPQRTQGSPFSLLEGHEKTEYFQASKKFVSMLSLLIVYSEPGKAMKQNCLQTE